MLKKGWQWPALIVGILASSLVINGITLYLAAQDPSFAVEPDYYEKAQRWDEHQAQERRNLDLGWRIELAVDPAPGPTGRKVVARLLDRAGAPVDGVRIETLAFHHARAQQVLSGTFAAQADHSYTASLPMVRPGMWEFRLRATRGEELFTQVVKQEFYFQ